VIGIGTSPERFERWSRTYERSWLQRFLFDRIHEAVLKSAAAGSQPGTVLDVGCGTGRLLRKVRHLWPNAVLIGVDPARGMVEQAQRLAPGITFLVGTAEHLPLDDASVDLVLSTLSFHHWRDRKAGCGEVARVLRPGGRLLLADHTAPRVLQWLGAAAALDPESVGEILESVGLCVERRTRLWSRWLWLLEAAKRSAVGA
jgi:ubiquinone/menaquinone biosynthesis C-methylase UbiE